MKLSAYTAVFLTGMAIAMPLPQLGSLLGIGNSDTISQLEETFDRNNPNGTPAAPGDPADLNGDGVINFFEAGAQAG
ncbi:hypothetical protein LRP88_02068 [Fusarium phalaenopsidis]